MGGPRRKMSTKTDRFTPKILIGPILMANTQQIVDHMGLIILIASV
jgi:hypothetical protein